MKSVRIAIAALAVATGFVPARVSAQASAQTAVVQGRVVDSIARQPVAAAEVQLMGTGNTSRNFLAFTDSTGSFRIAAVPPGRYGVVFFDSTIDDLALVPAVLAIDVHAGINELSLGTPGPERVLAATCGAAALRDSTGLAVGRVIDAESHQPLVGAEVQIGWGEVVVDHGLHRVWRSSVATTDAQGRFGACGVPDGPLSIRASAGGSASGTLHFEMPGGRVLRIRLAVSQHNSLIRGNAPPGDSGAAASPGVNRGTARLHGIVRSVETAAPIARAMVSVRGTGLSAMTDSSGTFALSTLPAGSQTLAVRALGYSPRYLGVSLRSGSDTETRVVLDKASVMMDTVYVNSKAVEGSEFLERKNRGMGYFLTRDQVRHIHPISFADIARHVPGLHPVMTAEGTVLRWRDGCLPTVYVNGLAVIRGEPWMGNALRPTRASAETLGEDIDFLVDPAMVTGVEVYSPSAAPIQYPGVCATVLIWVGLPPP